MRQPFNNKPDLGLPGDWKKLEHLVMPDAALDTLQIGPPLVAQQTFEVASVFTSILETRGWTHRGI